MSSRLPLSKTPAALTSERREGWHHFMRYTGMACVALAVLLLLMLLFLRIL